jgi:hypothetical protein
MLDGDHIKTLGESTPAAWYVAERHVAPSAPRIAGVLDSAGKSGGRGDRTPPAERPWGKPPALVLG